MRQAGKNSSRLRFEQLEPRQMLSAAPLSAAPLNDPAATPLVEMVQPASHSEPARGSFSPNGFHPNQIAEAYGFDEFGPKRGAGQTIAIVVAFHDPTIAHDLEVFDKQYALPAPPKFNIVTLDPAKAVDPTFGWPEETALDVEWAHAVAPGANILLVEAQANHFSDEFAAIDVASATPGVSVVSMSFGAADFSSETSYDSHFAPHPNITYVAGSGDHGAPPIYPSLSSYVVSVGGTTLKTNASGDYKSEVPWVGAGGGTSAFINEPSFQTNAGIQTGGKRGAPDIVFNADSDTGYSIYTTTDTPALAGWGVIGGTSASTPVAAGMFAIVNQQRKEIGYQPLHSADADLYSIYKSRDYTRAFHDITTGYINTNGSTPYIYAAKGYDLASGLGSPRADELIPLLASVKEKTSSSPSPAPSPGEASLRALLGSAQSTMPVPPSVQATIQQSAPVPAASLAASANGGGSEIGPPVVFAQSASLPLSTATLYAVDVPTPVATDLPTGDDQESDSTFLLRKRPVVVIGNGDQVQDKLVSGLPTMAQA